MRWLCRYLHFGVYEENNIYSVRIWTPTISKLKSGRAKQQQWGWHSGLDVLCLSLGLDRDLSSSRSRVKNWPHCEWQVCCTMCSLSKVMRYQRHQLMRFGCAQNAKWKEVELLVIRGFKIPLGSREVNDFPVRKKTNLSHMFPGRMHWVTVWSSWCQMGFMTIFFFF